MIMLARIAILLQFPNVGILVRSRKRIPLEVTVYIFRFLHIAVDLDMDDLSYDNQSYINEEMNRQIPPLPPRTNKPLSVPDKPTMAPPLPPEFDVSEGDSLSEQSLDQLIGLAPEKEKTEPKSIFKKVQSSVENGIMKVKDHTTSAFSKMLGRPSDNNDLIGIGDEDAQEALPSADEAFTATMNFVPTSQTEVNASNEDVSELFGVVSFDDDACEESESDPESCKDRSEKRSPIASDNRFETYLQILIMSKQVTPTEARLLQEAAVVNQKNTERIMQSFIESLSH